MTSKLFAAVRSEYPADGRSFGDCDEWVDIFPVLSDAVRAAEEWANIEEGSSANVRVFVAEGFASGEYGADLFVLRSAR